MTAPKIISGLGDVAGRYDVLFCDVWGVIHNGRERFPDACDALVRFRAEHGPVILVSNAPRPSTAVRPQLSQLSVPDAAWSEFVTSGDATLTELSRRAPGPAWAIGPDWDQSLYADTGVAFAEGPHDAAFISCTGLFDDTTETPADYRAPLEIAAARNLAMVCANPDLVVHRGDTLIYCAGSLAQMYATMGGEVVMAGKPHPPVYACALDAAARQLGRPVDPDRILCIGDGVGTDVRGANNQGLDCLFVAGGIHVEELLNEAGAIDPAHLEVFLSREGAHAAYAVAKFGW
jgi:HAD superfamily hydrolase (TIGR01459 family)